MWYLLKPNRADVDTVRCIPKPRLTLPPRLIIMRLVIYSGCCLRIVNLLKPTSFDIHGYTIDTPRIIPLPLLIFVFENSFRRLSRPV